MCPNCNKRYKTYEEKQTDVNIAIKLLESAVKNDFDSAYIVSADSDLIPAIKSVKTTFPDKKVVLVTPPNRKAKQLTSICDFHHKIKELQLKTCQFPDEIFKGKKLIVKKPSEWILSK